MFDPEVRQPSPHFTEHKPEPSTIYESSQEGAKELRITPEPEPHVTSNPELSIGPEPTMEIIIIYVILPVLEIVIWCVWAAQTIPESPDVTKSQISTHPHSPASSPALPPLLTVSPSTHPQPTICAVGSPGVCQSPSVSWLEDPLSLPPASESQTPPQPAPPWSSVAPIPLRASRSLPPPRSPEPVSPSAPPGSLVPPASPWSVVDHLRPRVSTPPATPRPFGSVRLLLPSGSALVLHILSITLAHRLSILATGSTLTCSAAVGLPPGFISPSSTMASPSTGSNPGWGLGPARLFLLSPVFFLVPPSI
ncbi:hypothetical protein H4Q32_013962 [Labeo rohita]|uniref:Uncharacterized protein n=1 Tax=Labeo rohita TaxID=84645 RepID=A0ABQ8LSM4_LABRO|nr:hypothetical protein H4Q32_013962 [Labeo rohita]